MLYLRLAVAEIIENIPPKDSGGSAGPSTRSLVAYVGPFVLFLLLLMVPDGVKKLPGMAGSSPEFWVYPLQTLLCAGMLIRYRREYPLAERRAGALLFGSAVGVVAIVVWLSPQLFFHFAPRTENGFDPTKLPPGSTAYFWTVGLRFARLVVVVPLIEEIFWRGFLLRYLIKENFLAVPFGTFMQLSFWASAVGFMLEHSRPDYPAALITGILYNLVAVRTRSLPACIVAHAVTNLLLGVYIMRTGQWGFW